MNNTKSNGNLEINAQLSVELIGNYLKDLIDKDKTNGVVLGLSGGIDSALLATIAVKTLGKDKVKVSFLFDRDSEKSSISNARKIANWLGLELEAIDMSPVMKDKKIYSPFIMRLLPYSATFNRLIQHFYRIVNRENPFKTTLKVGANSLEKSWLKRLMFNLTIRHIDNGFSERHMHRKIILEEKARKENFTLIGAANRSECEVGWFVKDGIDDLPIQPMTGLYKTQVWQLAAYLELPEDIQKQTPSPDMMLGIRDEFAIGHDYRRLDIILDLIEQQLSDDEMIQRGISKKEVDDVRELMKLSEWKRASYHEEPPVSGGLGGNVRI